MKSNLAKKLHEGIDRLGLVGLPEYSEDKLLAYLDLLAKWNAAFNLTAVREPDQMLVRHLLDSLSILPYVNGKSVIDVGTGAGLPGLVLAIARPDLKVTLLDSNGKKVRFLRQVVVELKLSNTQVVQSRAEQFEGQFDTVTSRAFASLADMLRWSAHLLAKSGVFLAMKGMLPDQEIAALPDSYSVSVISLDVPFLGEDRHLIRIVQ